MFSFLSHVLAYSHQSSMGQSSDNIIVGVILLGDWPGLVSGFHFIAKHGVQLRSAFLTSSRNRVVWLIDKSGFYLLD